MSTVYPAGLDDFPTLLDNVDQILAAHQNDRADAIEALEAKVGIDSSAVNTTLDYFLKHASGAYRTHLHDGTSDDGANIPDTSLLQITTASKVALSAIQYYPFKSGDLIISTVVTARTGWTNVSATYSNKFMRINATPLTTGGADTHTHAVGSFAVSGVTGSTTGTAGEQGNEWAMNLTRNTHTHSFSASVTGTSASGDNVPAYVQVCVFQKD